MYEIDIVYNTVKSGAMSAPLTLVLVSASVTSPFVLYLRMVTPLYMCNVRITHSAGWQHKQGERKTT